VPKINKIVQCLQSYLKNKSGTFSLRHHVYTCMSCDDKFFSNYDRPNQSLSNSRKIVKLNKNLKQQPHLTLRAASAINFWNCMPERIESSTSCTLSRPPFFVPALHRRTAHQQTMLISLNINLLDCCC